MLTPEEWVRQHFVNYLITVKKYPVSLIAIEKTIRLNDTVKRFDVVVYNLQKQPVLVAECKAPFIELDAGVIAQVQRYNLTLQTKYLLVTNGISDITFDTGNNVIELPDYTI